MGYSQVGQVCIMIHSGSRGLGHQVATDALTAMEKAMARDKIPTNDRQLACALIKSREGQVLPSYHAKCCNLPVSALGHAYSSVALPFEPAVHFVLGPLLMSH